MAKKSGWQVVPAILTLALVACEDSVTGIPESVVEPAPPFEGVTPVAPLHGGCVAPGADLISFWPGDDIFDDIAEPLAEANNISFNAKNGGRIAQLNDGDVKFRAGMVDQAFSFTSQEGQSVQFLEVADADELQPTNYTIDLWAQRTGDGQDSSIDAYGSILIMKARDDDTAGGTSYLISWRRDGHIVAFVHFGSTLAMLVSTNQFNPGQVPTAVEWVHVALTVDGSTAKLYINGAFDKGFTGPAGAQTAYGTSGQEGSIVIGSSHEGTRKFGVPRGFHGLIDEVDLYGRALSADEIAAIHASGNDGKCKGGNVVYPLTIDQATVRLDPKRRLDRDAFDIDGRLPLSLLQRFDPADAVRVGFAGIEQVIDAGSFVRKDDKWKFRASPRAAGGVWRMDLHDDGRFKLQASGPFDVDLGGVDFSDPVDFSLWFGPDIGEASIQLDGRLHYRSY